MSKKFILGTLFGATVAAGAALLFAPKKGEELREDLADKANDLKSVALDYVELATVKGNELKEAAVSGEWKTTLKNNVNDLTEQLKAKKDELVERFNQPASEESQVVVEEQQEEVTEA